MELVSVGEPIEIYKPLDLALKPDKLSWLVNLSLKAGKYSGGEPTEATIANVVYLLNDWAAFEDCEVQVMPDKSLPFFIVKFRTPKERERIFIICSNFAKNKARARERLLDYGKSTRENELRVTYPDFLFTEEEEKKLFNGNFHLKSYPDPETANPTTVARAYTDELSFVPSGELSDDFELIALGPSQAREVQSLYDNNYERHSFHNENLKFGRYRGIRHGQTKKLVAAAGAYNPFNLDGFGYVTIIIDNVRDKNFRDRKLGQKVLSQVIEESLIGNTFMPPSRLVVCDAINPKSEAMVRELGFKVSSRTRWGVYERLSILDTFFSSKIVL